MDVEDVMTVKTEGNDSTQKQQHLYKILVIGDYAVGKTSLIKRYTEGFFTPNYKLTIGVDFAVFDLQRPATFDAVMKWREDVNSKVVLANDEPIPCLLLANKCDLPGTVVDEDMLNKFCEEHNFIGWYATSAANNANVDEAFRFLVTRVLQVARDNQLPDQNNADNVAVAAQAPPKKSTECCS